MADETAVRATERAYAYTKDLIIRGRLTGGQLLSEGQICGELGVSRTPVHEAFLRLETEKLLALSSRKGAVVLPMSPHETKDVLEMREAIEMTAARRIIEEDSLGASGAASLRSILERQRQYVEGGDVDAFIEADEEFHTGVVVASGNAMAVHFFALLRDRQQRLRHQLLNVRPEHLVGVRDDHLRLIACLEAADADGYCEVLNTHVARHRGAL
jgi:DNA-binding GntR family transcriptional regulator